MKIYADLYRIRNKASQEEAGKIIGHTRQTYAAKEESGEFGLGELEALCAAWKDEKGDPLIIKKLLYGPAGEPPDRELVDLEMVAGHMGIPKERLDERALAARLGIDLEAEMRSLKDEDV